ncbi:MAG: Wadjet anti-phage system protein JetA family protein [Ardenticatenaceae bacterium]
MSALFDILPPTLFNPLAAHGAPIYAEVLLRLLGETERHSQPLSRSLVLDIVSEVLSTPDALKLTVDAVSPEEGTAQQTDESMDAIEGRARDIVTYLKRCGWLKEEQQKDYTRTYILPSYAFRLLWVLREIASQEALPLAGLICSIHDLLEATAEKGSAHIRLPEAYRQTLYLLNGLKELQHNIGTHIEQVLSQLEASAVLDQFFLYRNQVVDRAYHQLRTTDHVSRFRPAVLKSLTQLEQPEELHAAARRMQKAAPRLRIPKVAQPRRRAPEAQNGVAQPSDLVPEGEDGVTPAPRLVREGGLAQPDGLVPEGEVAPPAGLVPKEEEGVAHASLLVSKEEEGLSIEGATNQLLTQINEIRHRFESLDLLLQAIDTRHSQFVDSAVRTVELHLGANTTTSGQLHAILSHLLAEENVSASEPLAESYDSLVNIFHLSLVDADSLAPASRAPTRFVPDPIEEIELTDDEIKEAYQRTLHHLTRAVSRERVRHFAETRLHRQKQVRGAELPLSGPEELPFLIYLRAYGDGSLGYIVEEKDDSEWIQQSDIGYRDFVLRKSDKENTKT